MNAKTSMYNYLLENIELFKDRTALIFFGQKINFATLSEKIDRMAQSLKDLGIKKDDNITICLPNSPHAVVAFYAINRIGAVANIVHPLTPSLQLLQLMEKAQSKFLFMCDFAYFRYKDNLENANIKTVICRLETYMPKILGTFFSLSNFRKNSHVDYKSQLIIRYKNLLNSQKTLDVPDDSFDTPSIHLHSGGTAGDPKTVVLTNEAFNEQSSNAFNLIGINSFDDTRDKIMLGVLPMFHAFGLGVCFHMALSNGAATLLIPKFAGKSTVKNIKKHKVNIWVGVPTMYGRMINYKKFDGRYLKNVVNIFSGADSFPKNLKTKFQDLLTKHGSKAKVCEGYGLTETAALICVNTNKVYKEGSVGKPLVDTVIMAYDTEAERFCKPNECGELVVKGPQNMIEYLGDTEATNNALKKHGNDLWVHTGDYGCVDEENFVFFRQRIKRIVKISGVAIFPSEIEEAVTKLPFIKHACAVGVKREQSGMAIKLFVELKDGNAPSEKLKEQILTHCSQHIIKWAVPRQIVFEKSLPLTMMGKVDFKKLEE